MLEALENEKKLERYINLAGTHMNICALLSLMGNNNDALTHAFNAIKIIEQHTELTNDWIRTLIVAYQNVAEQLNYLERYEEADNYLRQGYEISVRKLGKKHVLTQDFKDKQHRKTKTIEVDLETSLEDSYNAGRRFSKNSYNLPELRIKHHSPDKTPDTILLDTTP